MQRENQSKTTTYNIGGSKMAKAGMRRPDPKAPHGTEGRQKMNIPKNDAPPVPEIQGKAKAGNKKANPIFDPYE